MQGLLHIQIKAWTPAVSLKRADNLIASKYTKTKAFVPSYEKERCAPMSYLLANEYQRMWWKERNAWEKGLALKEKSKKILLRSYVKRRPPQMNKNMFMEKPKFKIKKEPKNKDTVKKQTEIME